MPAGDISRPGLGISEEDEEILVGSVSIVFHLAATIQSLRDALQYNVIEMVKLCCKMKKLQVLHMVKPKKGKGVQERIEDLRNILMHNDIHIHVCLSET